MDPAQPFTESEVFGLALIILFGFLFLVGAVIWLYGKSQNRNLRQQALMSQREADYQKQLLEASIRGQEAERERLAKDLHDGVSSPLGIIKMKLAMQVPESEAVESDIERVIAEVRATSHDLLPPAFAERGLVSATQGLCDRLADLDLFAIDFTCNAPTRRFDPERELNVYRIVQELLNNCQKYAGAKQVNVELNYADGGLILRYQDDGKGFDYRPPREAGATPAAAGLGLSSIQARAVLLGADLDYQSAPGAGVRAAVHLKTNPDGGATTAG